MAKPKYPKAELSIISNENGILTLSTSGTKPAPSSRLQTWYIEWGDNNNQEGSGNPPAQLTHEYAVDGKYEILFIVHDHNGYSDGYDMSPFIVRAVPPIPIPPAGNVIAPSDIHYMGAIRLNQAAFTSSLQFTFGGLALRKVLGKTRFLVLQDQTYTYAPAEFESPAEFDSAGNLISGTPLTPNYASTPIAPFITNWGKNNDGSVYDFYHGIAGQWYDSNGNVFNDIYGGGGGAIWNCFFEGDRFHVMYGATYGLYHEWAHMFCTLDNPNNGVGPVSTAYGPFNIAKPNYAPGLRGAVYFLKTHDGGYGLGGAQAGSYQQGVGPDGPTLFLGFTPPNTNTPSGYPNLITVPNKGIVYYTLNGIMNPADGSIPAGQPIVSFRQYGYPYPYEASQGAHIAINPNLNGGIGTWTEVDSAAGMVYANIGTKHGYISIILKCSNHLIGSNQTGCTFGGQTVSHTWYAAGGNPLCDHGCSELVAVTGPVSTFREILFAIYDPAKVDEVKNGTRVDYTLDPEYYVYPKDDINSNIQPPSPGTPGVQMMGAAIDETNNMFYILANQADLTTPGFGWPLIYAFQVR
jgi:hypothetical protein